MRKPIPFGKYCLLDRISVGGMAEVFKARAFGAEGFAKTVAIKRILPNMAEDDEFITMFIDEAKIAVQLNHANICQIYELGKVYNSHYIVMEHIAGKDLLQLNNYFKRNKLWMPLEMAAYVMAQVCEGLDYAHRKRDHNFQELNLVHRDISPQNVLISYGGEVKIIDFGIAKAASRSTKTQVGVLKGKFGYMSPEQVRGLTLDRRSDIFAAGTVLTEILTAARLFVAETDFATLEKVRKVDISLPSEMRPDIPPELERIMLKALAREREERYQWASELGEDLQRFLVGQDRSWTALTMSEWMHGTFAQDIEKSKQHDEESAHIRSPQDLIDESAGRPQHDPGLEAEGETTVIYAQSEAETTEEPARPPTDAPAEIDRRITDPLPDLEEVEDLDEATEAVQAIDDDLFAQVMAGGPTSHPSAPSQPAATPSSPFASPTVGLSQPPPGAGPPVANKLSGRTMNLSADDLEMFVEEGGFDGPAGGMVDSRTETPAFTGADAVPTNPAPAPRSSIPSQAGSPIPTPAPWPPPAAAPPAPVPPAPLPPTPYAPAPPAPVAPQPAPLPPTASMAPPPAIPAEAPRFPQPLGVHFSEQSTSPSMIGLAPRRSLAREVVIGAVVAVAILGLGLSAWWLLSGGDPNVPEPEPGTSVLLVQTTPAEGVEVYVDGDLVGTGGRVVAAGLAPGARKLRVRAGDHRTYEVVLDLPAGEVAQHAVELTPGKDPVAKVKLAVGPKDSRVMVAVDGGKPRRYEPGGTRAWIDLSAEGPHTLRVTRPGFQAQVLKLALEPDEEREVQVTLEELFGTIRIDSDPGKATVKLDGKRRGKTPATIEPLAADRTWLLEVERRGYEPWSMAVKFDADHPVFERKIELIPKGGAKEKKVSRDLGYLTVSAGMDVYAQVLVDGEDIGRRTPITSSSPIELPPGKHTVTLVLGDKQKETGVEIIAGKTASLRFRLR